jgi:hypothetical protein
MRIQAGRIVVPSLITLVLAGALLAGPAVTAGAAAAGPGPLPVLYNLGGGTGSVWNKPQVRPRKFFIFADGSAALIGMRWARWTRIRAVTSQAVYYDRTGPCCTGTDQHRHKVTVTLSRVRQRGGPRRGPYFVRMVITGHHFTTQTLTYTVFRSGGTVIGSWLSHSSAALAWPGSAARRTVVHDSLGWSQNLIKPSFLGAMFSNVPPRAIDGNFVLKNLRWSAWTRTSAHATGRIGWAQPGQGGNGINRQAPVKVRLYAVATHHGRRYFSRLAFSFTWRHHAYAGKVRFHDPCGNTAGCWTAPGMPVA